MIGENLRKVREEKGFGVNQLSRMSGVNASYISALERGEKKNPGVAILKKLCDAMEVSLEYLMNYDTYSKVPLTSLDNKSKETGIEDIDAIELDNNDFLKIPIVGSIRAGEPIFAEDNFEGYVPMLRWGHSSNDITYFGLRVKGDSMNLEFIEGTLLVIEKTPCIETGEIGVIRVDGDEATVKKVSIENEFITLIPMSTNPHYIPHTYNLKTDDVEVIGKVVQAIKMY